MDKQDTISNYNHGISLLERKNLVITGVKKLDNFDSEQFLIETIMGYIIIKGENLELVKLDTLQGNVTIKGMINLLTMQKKIKKTEKIVYLIGYLNNEFKNTNYIFSFFFFIWCCFFFVS